MCVCVCACVRKQVKEREGGFNDKALHPPSFSPIVLSANLALASGCGEGFLSLSEKAG